MKIDIKEISKIKIEKDEMLIVELNTTSAAIRADVAKIFRSFGLQRVIVADNKIIKKLSIVKDRGGILH